MDRRLISYGRDPDSPHVFCIAHAFMGETQEEGQAQWDKLHHDATSDANIVRSKPQGDHRGH